MKIAIGSDHRGFEHKSLIIQKINTISWIDVGCFSAERCDYPVFAKLIVNKIIKKEADLGILLCGSGIGMAITANRFAGIYAGLCWNSKVARAAKEDDNINILVLPSDYISHQESLEIINTWLNTQFKGGRYQARLDMIDNLIKKPPVSGG